MIFLINGTLEMWVAIPILNKALFTSWKYPYVMALDISVFIATTLLIIRASFIISKYKMFHLNLRILLIFQLCQWIEILIARFFMFQYLLGYRFLGNTRKIYHHFWTDNTEEMVPIPNVIDEWPLFLGGFLYTHHFASCIFFLFSVSAERAIASFYLR
uniref:Serpentine receptor class gamma n=1 Tax=Caenorhabditis tropicalis TaxID=1561998 RepID=A0A1I7U3P4_9PELO